MQELIDVAKAIGIPVLIIDEDTDFDSLPSFASLFPQSQEPKQ